MKREDIGGLPPPPQGICQRRAWSGKLDLTHFGFLFIAPGSKQNPAILWLCKHLYLPFYTVAASRTEFGGPGPPPKSKRQKFHKGGPL